VKYGGNTPCVEVQAGRSRVIVDAGTGIYPLGQQLGPEPNHYHLLFSHVHWDHVQGLPFFAPLHNPAVTLTIYATARYLPMLRELLSQGLRGIYIPTPLEQLQARIDFQVLQIGEPFAIDELEIDTVMLNHPYLSVGFRFRANGRSAIYYSDTAPFSDILFGYEYRPRPPKPGEGLDIYEQRRLAELHEEAVNLSYQADLLVFDGHFLPDEYQRFSHFGHSTPEHALEIAQDAQVKRLAIFHHAPARTDDALDRIKREYHPRAAEIGLQLTLAREGETVTL